MRFSVAIRRRVAHHSRGLDQRRRGADFSAGADMRRANDERRMDCVLCRPLSVLSFGDTRPEERFQVLLTAEELEVHLQHQARAVR